MKVLPAGTLGQDDDTPRRLTRRQKRMPMGTVSPDLKRMLVKGKRISTS